MPLSTCTVSGVLYDATGAVLANEPLTIIPRDWAVGADGLVSPETVTTTTNGSGVISVVLGRQAIYTVQTNRPNIVGRRTFVITVPNAATADIELIADFTNASRQAEFLDGTAGNPAFRFVNDTDTGLFLKAANTIGISTGGAERASVDSNGVSSTALLVGNGSASTPAIRFTSDTNTGLWRIGADAMGVAANGAEVARFTTSGVRITGAVTGTAVTQSSTDATAGRLTRVGDFGLGTPSGTAQVNVTLDSATVPGTFSYLGSDPAAPAPGNGGTLFVERHLTTFVRQEAGWAGGDRWQRRSSDGGSTWTPWRRVYNAENLLGTVAQASGIPTGAVIERGSNANGEFVRFADGTQICTFVAPGTACATAVPGASLFASGASTETWTFPATFSAAPQRAGDGGSSNRWVCFGVGSVASAAYRVYSHTSSGAPDAPRLIAIGRWF